MEKSIFEIAKDRIDPYSIERLFPGGKWKNKEYWIRSPLRSDSRPNSFHISKDGMYYDHATNEGGDFIDLVSRSKNISLKESAELIANEIQISTPKKTKPKIEKPKPIIPIPDDKLKTIKNYVSSDFFKNEFGEPKAYFSYSRNNKTEFVVVRFEKNDTKQTIPFYYSEKNKWESGRPYNNNFPIFGLDELTKNPDLPVLIVEGETCGVVDVKGYIVVSWLGGSQAYDKTDWSPLKNRKVVLWSDRDTKPKLEKHEQPGMKAMLGIKGILGHGKVLDVYKLSDKKDGWDIADAEKEKLDLLEIINNTSEFLTGKTEIINNNNKNIEEQFFRFLGYSDDLHYFLLTKERIVVSITRSGFTSSKILQLAPLAFWSMCDFVSPHGNIKVTQAQDWIQTKSQEMGRFDSLKIRGTGVWRDDEKFVLNTGSCLEFPNGKKLEYHEFKSKYFYVSSSITFDELGEKESDYAEGLQLQALFDSQKWVSKKSGLACLGWSLIAPMAGALIWRPHIWIEGKKGTGKSYVLENLMERLLGSFVFKGSGGSTESAVRRSVRNTALPIILDEMKITVKNDENKIYEKLNLARDASSDISAIRAVTARDGGVDLFVVRSMFCFSSDQPPQIDHAIDSRILRSELKSVPNEELAEFTKNKKKDSKIWITCLKNPEKFRKRMFNRIERITRDIQFLSEYFLSITGNQREADNWSPIIASIWHLTNDNEIQNTTEGAEFLKKWESYLSEEKETLNPDEDSVIENILGYSIGMEFGKRLTVSEILTNYEHDSIERKELERNGIKLSEKENIVMICKKNPNITKMLNGTTFEKNYDAQIKRNDFCTTQKTCVQRRVAGHKQSVRLFDWGKFKKKYIDEE
jgi:putative DNA primase/helicase